MISRYRHLIWLITDEYDVSYRTASHLSQIDYFSYAKSDSSFSQTIRLLQPRFCSFQDEYCWTVLMSFVQVCKFVRDFSTEYQQGVVDSLSRECFIIF